MEDSRFNVVFAKDDKEAIKIILREVEGEEIVVKSKSNVSKEIKLTRRLVSEGIKAAETDIGDRLSKIADIEKKLLF